MGSLVPGWDAAATSLPPRDLQEIDEAKELAEGPQKESYFAKLEKSKTLRRSSVGADGRQRTDSVGIPSSSLMHSATLPPHSATLPPTIQHSTTMPRSDHPTAPSLGRYSSPPKQAYAPTDWEAEIKSLQSKESRARMASLARRSLDSNVSASSASQQPAWWAQLDTGALNQSMQDRAAEPEQAGGAAHALKGVKLDFVGSNLH